MRAEKAEQIENLWVAEKMQTQQTVVGLAYVDDYEVVRFETISRRRSRRDGEGSLAFSVDLRGLGGWAQAGIQKKVARILSNIIIDVWSPTSHPTLYKRHLLQMMDKFFLTKAHRGHAYCYYHLPRTGKLLLERLLDQCSNADPSQPRVKSS